LTTKSKADGETNAAENEDDDDEEEDDDATPPPPSASSATSPISARDDGNARQVSTAEAEAYAKECGLLFFEASAKTGMNVGEVFTEIGE
jgi:Ras-related protein Rab-5C